jgi:hypothetical protein
MDKRKTKRVKVRHLARVQGKLGVLNDISEEGFQISIAMMPKKRRIEVSFEASGRMINVMGFVKWFRRQHTYQKLNTLGICVSDAPEEFYQYIHSIR